ncbi:MAG: succinate dehydrogenase, hydrophobic membrane anchor protein [Steroidobacteraceae bacterium]
MNLRTPLARVLGAGSAKQGVHHWWLQRVTSVALVPLSIWLLVSLLSLPSFDHWVVSAWMAQGSSAVLLILLVLVAAWHSQLGLQVIVEDYVHGTGARALTLVALHFAHVRLAATGVLAVRKVALRSAP